MLPGTVPLCGGSAGGQNVVRNGVDLDGETEWMERSYQGVETSKFTFACWVDAEVGTLFYSGDASGAYSVISVSFDDEACYIQLSVTEVFSYKYFAPTNWSGRTQAPMFLMVSVDVSSGTPVVRAWTGTFGDDPAVEEEVLDQYNYWFELTSIPRNYDAVGGGLQNQPIFGVMGDVYFIDGIALTDPTVFAQDFGLGLAPVSYEGAFGANGFHLDFSDAQNMCADTSGNGNNFSSGVGGGAG